MIFKSTLSKNLKIKIFKTMILLVVLYGCETWSLTLKEECRLRVFENRILRRIFGPKRDENRERRRLHNEEFHGLYRSPNIVRVIKSRRLRWAGYDISFFISISNNLPFASNINCIMEQIASCFPKHFLGLSAILLFIISIVL